MFHIARPLFLTCETPLHAGSGDSLGIVDMPIQRERHTSFPKIEASSLKGALREAFEGKLGRTHTDIIKSFGPEADASEYAGALGFTDARLLLFPVKSMKGVFAWITCPKALQQFAEDLALANQKAMISNLPTNPSEGEAVLMDAGSALKIGNNLILEEYTFQITTGNIPQIEGKSLALWIADTLFTSGLYWHTKAQKDIVVISDDDFKDFTNLSTEVITRIKINPVTGTVQKGALFTEEYLPAESVLYSLVLASPEFAKKEEDRKKDSAYIMDFFANTITQQLSVVQLGGNATLGKGLLRTKIISPVKQEENV